MKKIYFYMSMTIIISIIMLFLPYNTLIIKDGINNFTPINPYIKNILQSSQNNNQKIKAKKDIEIVVETETVIEEQPTNRWEITLTEEEIDLLARIVMLEAGGESDWGKDAVVEVIFNRMYDEDFPNTLEGVLSQKGQFATWKNRNISAATPTEEVYESIYCVLSGQTDVLPFETVYFSRGGEPGKEIQIVIENHVFCNK